MIADKWIRNKSDEKAIDEGCTWDPKYADRVKDFLYKFCRQSIGEFSGQPLELMQWQIDDIVAPLYSWRRPDGTRRFRQAGIWIPKNNGKSTLMSGLSLYHLIADGEMGAQVVNLAATIEQANIIFKGALDCVLQSPMMSKRNHEGRMVKGGLLWARPNIKTIECDRTRSTYKVMSGDRGGGKCGFSISFLAVDELCEQPSRDLFSVMSENLKKRRNSLLISVSTAGFRRESIGYEQFCYASRVKSSEIIDTSFLPVVYQADPKEDWKSLETFKKCNPSYGVTIRENDVVSSLTEAINEPRKENSYKTLRLNLWTGSSIVWIGADKWAACGEDFEEEEFHGRSEER